MKIIVGSILASMLVMSSANAEENFKIDGSSTVFPIIEAMVEEFTIANESSVQISIGVSGTGGGFKKFCRGEIDIVNASRPITKSEMKVCEDNNINYIELPIAYDAITVVTNIKNDFVDSLTLEQLNEIWKADSQSKITSWKQVNDSWPDLPLSLYGAGSDSGTFDYFTEAVTGKAKNSRGDYFASEDDNVLISGIEKDVNALGYLPYAYYIAHKDKLKIIGIVNKDGNSIVPTHETIMTGDYSPLSRPLFIYVKQESLNKVRDFSHFFFNKESRVFIEESQYVVLPDSLYEYDLQKIANGITGTVFKGESVTGLSLEEFLIKESQ